MSMTPTSGNNLPDIPNPLDRPVGLEDFGPQEQTLPMITINHRDLCFEDSLTGRTWQKLEVVALGLIKQRILWPATLADEDEKSYPLCRSYDSNTGYPAAPQVLPNGTTYDLFPWEASGFENQGQEMLPCATCRLKEWSTHPTRGGTPWCAEQFTFALMLPNENGFYPSLLKLQRSALKSARKYLSGFVNEASPLFTVWTSIELESRKKGTNTYGTPKFVRMGETDTQHHRLFAETYRQVRLFLQTPRTFDDEFSEDDEADVPVPVSVSPAPPQSNGSPAAPAASAAPPPPQAAQAPAPAPAQAGPSIVGNRPQQAPAPAPVQAPAYDDSDDEIPF